MRVRSALLGLTLCIAASAQADEKLAALLAGTEVTPPLSGLQVSLVEGGAEGEGFSYGFAQLGDGQALRRDHKIRVASISKLFVAIGAMRLVERGALDLDGDIGDVLGYALRNPAFADRAITLRQLLSHTSSLRDGSAYFIGAGEGGMRDFFVPGAPYWDGGRHFAAGEGRGPGDFFTYANLNFGVIGALIERAADERFDLYMERHVLGPMGLEARFDPCAIDEDQRAAAFRKRDANGVWRPAGPWVVQVDGGEVSCFYGWPGETEGEAFLSAYRPGDNATLFSPQGGLRASADDLVQVLRMLAAGGELDGTRILEPETVAAMLAPEWHYDSARGNGLTAGEAEPGGPTDGLMSSYGLSVHRIDMGAWGFDGGPALMVGHLGEAYGVLSHALLDPETGDGIAAIITGTADDPAVSPPGTSPLYRVEEEIVRWWLARRDGGR